MEAPLKTDDKYNGWVMPNLVHSLWLLAVVQENIVLLDFLWDIPDHCGSVHVAVQAIRVIPCGLKLDDCHRTAPGLAKLALDAYDKSHCPSCQLLLVMLRQMLTGLAF